MGKNKDIVTGIVYTLPTERNVIPAGPDGSLGDLIIQSGLIYKTPDFSRDAIGTYSLTQVTTAIGIETEARLVTDELSFNQKYAKKSWISKLKPPFKIAKQTSDITLSGVEEFPLGGVRLDGLPATLGIATGTGRFIGAEGTCDIDRVLGTEFVKLSFTLV